MADPIDSVGWRDPETLVSNEYNPNQQSTLDQRNLRTSIELAGWTTPIIVRDPWHGEVVPDGVDKVIVDGQHRWLVAKSMKLAKVPTVLVDLPPDELRAVTVLMNKARGVHGVEATAAMVKQLHDSGKESDWIQKHLCMDAKEVERFLASEAIFLQFMAGHDGGMEV